MACKYYCDACGEDMCVTERYYINYFFPMAENLSKFEFCKSCMKKVTKFIKSLKEK